MPPLSTTAKLIFDSAKILRVIISTMTISAMIVVIAACISVGVVLGLRKITTFVHTSTVLIVQSNMKIILDRRVAIFEYPYISPWSPTSNVTNKNIADTLNSTLSKAFPDSLLRIFTSPLGTVSRDTSDPSLYRYIFLGKVFFTSNQTADEIKNALKLFQPIISLSTFSGDISSAPASFNRLLSNVSDTRPTNLTLSNMDGIKVTLNSTDI